MRAGWGCRWARLRASASRSGWVLLAASAGCAAVDAGSEDAGDAGTAGADAAAPDTSPSDLPYASELVSFDPGPHAGFGQADLPGVVLGPPGGGGRGGSLDVLSLGVGGEIVVGFGDRQVVDGPGTDFVVFENAFYIAGGDGETFAEFGEVSVSEDGEHWDVFPCDPGEPPTPQDTETCAGQTPTDAFEPGTLLPLDPSLTGGDAFDLATLGVERARFVRIRDRARGGEGNSAGFDLDAVGLVHGDPVTHARSGR